VIRGTDPTETRRHEGQPTHKTGDGPTDGHHVGYRVRLGLLQLLRIAITSLRLGQAAADLQVTSFAKTYDFSQFISQSESLSVPQAQSSGLMKGEKARSRTRFIITFIGP